MGVKRFSERIVAAPFGRYQAGDEVEPPANEVLVGREGQRAFFIDLLLRMGRRGAFLVTGRRGVGKTSFVHHCITEYRNEVYKRFLHSNVGRVTFWDRAGILILGLTVLLLGLILSEMTEVLMLPVSDPHSPHTNILLWLIIAPLALICLYPLLYAREVWGAILEARRERGRPRLDAAPATVITLAIAVAVWLIGPFGAPAVSMSRIFVGLCTLYVWVQATSFNRGDGEDRRLWKGWWLATFTLAFVIGLTVLGAGNSWPSVSLLVDSSVMEFKCNVLWAISLLGTGLLLRGLHLLWSVEAHGKLSARIRRSPQVWYLSSSALLFLLSLPWLFLTNFSTGCTAIGMTAAAVMVILFIGKPPRTGHASFHPQPLLLLTVKGLICTIVALQLIHPVISKLKWPHPTTVTPGKSPEIDNASLRPPLSLYEVSGISFIRDEPLQGPLQTQGSAVFHGRTEELRWLVVLFLALLTVYFLEYEWIVRPFVPEREDYSINPSRVQPEWRDQQLPADKNGNYSELAQLTLPWVLHRAWLPILIVSVNLGFEKLDHRRVVYAMLAGLRSQYNRAFLTWNSGLANLGRLLAVLTLMLFVTLTGDRWFNLPTVNREEDLDWIAPQAKNDYAKICDTFEGRQKGAGIVNIICKLKWNNSVFHVLYYNLIQFNAIQHYKDRENHLLFYLLPYREAAWPPDLARMEFSDDYPPLGAEYPPLLEEGINFRVYHLGLFLFFYLVGRWLLHRLPAIPYQDIVTRIDEVMDNLAARTSVTSTTGRWKPAQWLQGFFVDERVRQTEQDPVDPRTVEFVFLQILRDVQETSIQLPGGRNQLVSLPTPEIIFIFDELDKLGTRLDPDEGTTSSPQQAEILHAERRRSMELHKLLADMKNLLSSAPARFVFVGGRNLHDEWLADQTARQPLLTNIFDAEVYLPSLLTDFDDGSGKKLHQLIEVYVHRQVLRAKAIYRRSLEKRWLPSLGLPLHLYQTEIYVELDKAQQQGNGQAGELLRQNLPTFEMGRDRLFPNEVQFHRDFVQFLTYRSMGNPKRLKELLGTFVRPVGRVLSPADYDDLAQFKACDHVLYFGDSERFRIQLLARIYRHLALTFELGLVRRDDKLAVSVFYITDFLFKFHRRAFSWSNLERVDELVHIHRAPDLREVLEAIVIHWSDRFLHRIRNGMYDFRFRSDLAREMEYISRQSHEEMAAFNFTLDESQALKSVFETDINRFKDENSREIQDLLAGLGELHEFNQEYETARFYYRRAASSLDAELKDLIGGSPFREKESSAIEIIGGKAPGRHNARLFMTWGIARLRLMLQVGMTFEVSKNFERAEVEYRNARTLARSLLIAMLDQKGRDTGFSMSLFGEKLGDIEERLHALKHLNLIYQPAFAEAWIAEKLAGGVDTSIALVEKELWQLRNLLPFVREPEASLSVNPAKVKSSNFALIISELHNKAGDLYFFKGRQAIKIRRPEGLRQLFTNEGWLPGPQRGMEGYLLRAHYHYAVGLHELRRFTTHRRHSSKYKLNIWSTLAHKPWNTIERSGWSDFIYRSAGGTFNDLAEVMLGRISLLGLLREIGELKSDGAGELETVAQGIDRFVRGCSEWLERAPVKEDYEPAPEKAEAEEIEREGAQIAAAPAQETTRGFSIVLRRGPLSIRCGTLGGWLGLWNVEPRDPSMGNWKLLLFEESTHHTGKARLLLALHLTLAGARYLEKGGYIEDAAREHLKVCETINYYLWWALTVRKLAEWKDYLPDTAKKLSERTFQCDLKILSSGAPLHDVEGYWFYLMEVALYALKRADELFLNSRRGEAVKQPAYLIGDKIPTAALTLACSLGLAARRWRQWIRLEKDLAGLIGSWIGNSKFLGFHDDLRKILEISLVRHSYPMINRLLGLKILIDDAVLSGSGWSAEQTVERTLELLDLSANLNAPLHFTPLHSGTTCALVSLKYRTTRLSEENRKKLDRIRAAAKRELSDSEEMYTLRRSFYENIADLYYLYDDFNDRQIHFNHAIQMAGTELSGLLRYLLDHPEYRPAEEKVTAETLPASST